MKKSLGIGFLTLGISTIIAVLLQDISLYYKISGGIGIGALILSGVTFGAFISGDRMRANYYSEEKSEREKRVKTATNFFLAGLPNIIGSILFYMRFH
ncbi:DUF5316 domain-containing protein [Fredinandcohnia sp. 179-A 10B2 NHS]|uniref:DUF5316 domain-containing protein n=1 Tax=Fredinandcohnia sp. 179-A 10B2 NHS TaxID=3235176 RepID=UPI0039A3B9B1